MLMNIEILKRISTRFTHMAKVLRSSAGPIKCFLISAILATSGCAQILSKWDLSLPEKLVVKEENKFVEKIKKPIIVVRWPAILDNRALNSIIDIQYDFIQRVTGNNLRGIVDYTLLPDLLPHITTFYSADLYFSIRRAVPNAVILLEPTLLQGVSRNKISDKPIADISIPADFVVDIAVDQSASHVAFVSGGFYFSLRGIPALSTNCGLYIAMEHNFPKIDDKDPSKCSSYYAHMAPMNIWWSGVSNKSEIWPITISEKLPPSSVYTIRYPLLADSNHGAFNSSIPAYVGRGRPDSPKDAEEAPVHPYIENFAKTIALAVQSVPIARENSKAMAEYAEYFDKELSDKLRVGATLSIVEDKNFRLLKRLLDSELSVRAKHDEKIAREISAGDFGQSFRDIRLQMYKEYDKRMLKTWTSVARAAALHGALINNANSTQALIGAENSTINQFNNEMAAIGREYYKFIAPMVADFEAAAIDAGNGLVTIKANDQAVLRTALIDVYRKHKVVPKANPRDTQSSRSATK